MGLKSKLIMTMATSAAGAAMIAGGTFALFSHTATNNGNTFTAGIVNVSSTTATGGVWSGVTNISNVAPGDSFTGTLTVKNTGTLTEWVKVTPAGTGVLFTGSTPLGVTTTDANVFKLASGASQTLTYTAALPIGASNAYQGQKGAVDFNVQAVQARNNTDTAGTGPDSWS